MKEGFITSTGKDMRSIMERRLDEIIKGCKGSILDIGCVQHFLKDIKTDSRLHGKLAEIICNLTEIYMLKAKNLLEEEVENVTRNQKAIQ